jgi:hypothetical protein
MGGDGRGGQRLGPHLRLDEAPVHAGRQPRGGIAVAEGVDRRPRRDTPRVEGNPQGVLHTAAWQRYCGSGHACPPPARGGTDPYGRVVGFPVRASSLQGRRWQGPIAILGACASAHGDTPAGTVKVGNLPGGAFLEAQATGADGGATPPRAKQFAVCQQGSDLCETEDDWEFLVAWGADEGQRGPCPRHGGRLENRDAAPGAGTRTARAGLAWMEA